MLSFFKNQLYASILFFIVLGIDIYVKLGENPLPIRYFTKSVLIIILFLFYFYNRDENNPKNKYFIFGLLSFWIGDILLLLYETPILYMSGLTCFIIGKLFYSKRFSHQNDFNIASLIPFFVVIFSYMVIVILYVYDNLDDFFLPTLAYLFAAMLMALFAYLRKDSVNKSSFYLVILGIFFSIISDTIGVLQSFYNPDIAYHKITIMLFYALFQYLVVIGLIKEKTLDDKTLEDNFIRL
ncbi:lysoplasmalogenase [Olleya sp. YS]|uniref:lysoplasmalogenase n=1 Tax=Olleya sp. YS TaxID=3028318 RepID=UPI0024341AAE|nr:lysoplasmalogenase [Olleya sp. YS]WGD34966.1 lysoplasmalogenase [Olleya sp. YS]